MSAPPPLLVLGALTGLCLGSFAATAAIRMTRSEQALVGRSHCDGCGVQLSFAQTLPIAAFIRLGGACNACGGRIDRTHLVGELAGAAIVVSALATVPLASAVLLTTLGLALLASSVIDVKTQKLPDLLTGVIAATGLGAAWLRSPQAALEGFAAGALSFIVLETTRRAFLALRGRHGLGFGDVKLIAALAFWLGLATPWAVFLAAAIGLAAAGPMRRGDGRFAFGPFIAIGAWIVGLMQEVHPWLSLA
jgi:leader peptidase (prepilin peptidase)/N-methyltransferase